MSEGPDAQPGRTVGAVVVGEIVVPGDAVAGLTSLEGVQGVPIGVTTVVPVETVVGAETASVATVEGAFDPAESDGGTVVVSPGRGGEVVVVPVWGCDSGVVQPGVAGAEVDVLVPAPSLTRTPAMLVLQLARAATTEQQAASLRTPSCRIATTSCARQYRTAAQLDLCELRPAAASRRSGRRVAC